MKCPKCKGKILQKAGDDIAVRLTGKVTVGRDGICRAQCYWCKEPIEVPLELRKGLDIEGERFFVRPA